MATLPWKKIERSLHTKPLLSEGMVSMEDDRSLEITYVILQEMEDNSKKIQKEVKKYEECLSSLQRADDKMASDLNNSQLCQDNEDLRRISDELGSLVYQMGHNTEDMIQLAQKTVREPMKKLNSEYPQIQVAVKRRDLALQEAQRAQAKFEKLEKTGAAASKKEQAKRCYLSAKDDFEKANKLLLLELPQFYDRRIDYFQPCLQAMVRSQVDYYGCSTRLHTKLGNQTETSSSDEEFSNDLEKRLAEIRALSIVGN